MRVGQELANVRVACARLNEHRQDGTIFHGQFCPNDRSNRGFFCPNVETRSSIHSVAIGESDRGNAQFRRALGQLFRERGATQKAERTPRMQFDV